MWFTLTFQTPRKYWYRVGSFLMSSSLSFFFPRRNFRSFPLLSLYKWVSGPLNKWMDVFIHWGCLIHSWYVLHGQGQMTSVFCRCSASLKVPSFSVDGMNRFECPLARHPFWSSTRFRKLSPLLLVVTRVTLVGTDMCLSVYKNWTSLWEGPSSAAPSTRINSMSLANSFDEEGGSCKITDEQVMSW